MEVLLVGSQCLNWFPSVTYPPVTLTVGAGWWGSGDCRGNGVCGGCQCQFVGAKLVYHGNIAIKAPPIRTARTTDKQFLLIFSFWGAGTSGRGVRGKNGKTHKNNDVHGTMALPFLLGGGPQFIGEQQNTPPRKNQIPGATPGIPWNIPKLQVTVGATLEDINRNMKWYETLQLNGMKQK